MDSKWETVGKSKQNTKAQKRTVADTMPKLDNTASPVEVSKSMFGAIDDKPKIVKKQPLQEQSLNQSNAASKAVTKKPKKPQNRNTSAKYKYESIEEALINIDVASLYDKANQSRSKFPKNPNIWLRDLVSHLNDMLSCPDDSAALQGKDFSYPLSKASKVVQKMLQEIFTKESQDTIKELLFKHCVACMVENTTTDQPTWGYRLCIQILAQGSPNACCNELEKQLEKIMNTRNVPKRCLAYMWALGQVGVKHQQFGLKVWLKVMLPMIQTKNLAEYVVHYLETLLLHTKSLSRLVGTIDAKCFMEILNWTFNNNTGLSANLRERLQDLYPSIRNIATGDSKYKILFFKQFLDTSADVIKNLRPKLLEVIFDCLVESSQCFSIWRERYTVTLPQSKILLEYLDARWAESIRKLPPKQFSETIRAFHNTNTDAALQSSSITSIHEFKAVNEICKIMHGKLNEESHRSLSRCHSVFIPLLVALVAIGVGLLMYDVHSHGGTIEKAATYRMLQDNGVLDTMWQAWAKVAMVLEKIVEWLRINIPYYWSRVQEVVRPTLSYISITISNAITWFVEVSIPARAQIGRFINLLLVKGDEMFKHGLVYAYEVYGIVLPYLSNLWKWLVETLSALVSVFSGDLHWCCVRDAVVKYSQLAFYSVCDLCARAWAYILHAVKLAGDYISGENM